MIIWGAMARQKATGEGTFMCPRCVQLRHYVLHAVNRYFTLYFIPLIKTETLAEFATCSTCSTQFGSWVLALAPNEIVEAVRPWACEVCHNRNSASEHACVGCHRQRRQAPPPLPTSSTP